MVDNNAGLVILDVTNPTAPVRLGGYDISKYAYHLAVSGSLAYVTDSRGLQIIDPTGSPDLQSRSDTGISSIDNITADNTPTFSVDVPSGLYFHFYRDGVRLSGDLEIRTAYTTAVQADGTYFYTVAAVNAAGNVSPQSPPLRVTIHTTAPTVAASVVNGGAAQRSNIRLAVQFSENVSTTWDAGDLKLINRDSGVAVNVTGVTPTYDAATQTATWNLSGIALEDGYYRATLQAAGISDVAGNLLAGGNYPIDFFRLLGDTDGNAAIDIFDVAKLQVNYGSTNGMSPAEGDFDGNGTVDIFDVALLQVQYGKTLTAPSPMPAEAPGVGAEERGHSTFSPRDGAFEQDLDAKKLSVPVGALPLVATQPGHSPSEFGQMAESLGGRVSGPPEEPSQIRHGVSCYTERRTRSVRSTAARRLVASARPRISAVSPLAKSLAVHHVAETAAWESAIDEVLEAHEA